MPEIGRIQLSIMPPARQQPVVIALLDDLPIVQYNDPVGGAHCRETVGNDDAGTTLTPYPFPYPFHYVAQGWSRRTVASILQFSMQRFG